MSWALRRQIFYLGIVLFFIAGTAFLILYPAFNKPPTCMDGKINGDETGVDCGGSCLRACIAEVEDVSILWSRSFQVVPGRYNAVAYLTNHNENKIVEAMSYRFRFADADNLYLGERVGATFVPPEGNFAVFEGGVDFGESTPVYTTFEFTGPAPAWLQVSPDKVDQIKVLIRDIILENELASPTLTAKARNSSLFTIPDINIVAILYDEWGNAVNASRTFIEELAGEEERVINFTWPEGFKVPVALREIIPIFNVAKVSAE